EYASRRFIMSDAGKWIASHAHEYGFIIRYPFWAENTTGVTYEPWHIRYVGKPHAEIIYRTKTPLENYADLYDDGVFYKYGDYIISHQVPSDGKIVFPSSASNVFVSEDNMGGYFVWA
ncbi:MAG: D-alanyl-D-alanine carboxypeptidase family protein, partial [Eubacteriales bacterium]